jgi:hypothetical protein
MVITHISKRLSNYLNITVYTKLIVTIALITFLIVGTYVNISFSQQHLAYAHFFGSTKTIGNYRIVFQPFPTVSAANESSTLNFSILDKDNANVNNVYAALAIREKNTGKVVEKVPYKFYEFSDITFPYKFRNNTDYAVTIEVRINGDTKYQDNPLTADFDISVRNIINNPFTTIPFANLILYHIIAAVIIIVAGVTMYVHLKKKKKKKIIDNQG